MSGSPTRMAVATQRVFFFIFRINLNRRRGRQMPVRMTHEPLQASRGGLNGSDGSGRTLLTVRNEAGRRSVEMREDGGDRLRLSSGSRAADHAGHRAESRAQVALVGRVASAGDVVVVGALKLDLGGSVTTARAMGVLPVVVRLLSHLNFGLHARARGRAHHGSSQRAPKREQHCHQHEEPDAKRFHSC